MITVRDVELRRGSRLLLDGAELTIHPGQKVGLVGTNGCGKTSLFALLRGALSADRGDLVVPAGWRIVSVEQETPALLQTALDYTLDGDQEFRRIQQELENVQAQDADSIAVLHQQFEQVDAYTVEARAAQLLAGLGFDSVAQQRQVREFSGGWRMRLNLARALLVRSDLLLLDEPTNHLDLDAVVWLERWLQRYAGTLIVIAHDREFLDQVVGIIVHCDQQRLHTYSGNYSAFEVRRGAQLLQQRALFATEQRQRGHLQQYIDRFRYKASKARQAQSRIKALERLQAAAPLVAASGFEVIFAAPTALSSPLIHLHDVAVGYGAGVILEHIQLNLLPGSRIALLGRNGAGKSTLVKLLAGTLQPVHGQVERGKNLVVGYFAQQQLEALDVAASPMAHLQRLSPLAAEQALRDFLGSFGFHGAAALAPVGRLSGGEKTRLALAILIWQKPNLLLLDEPTNHLDMEMRAALVIGLQQFTGAVVVVSHDRHLLRTVVDELYVVRDKAVVPFAGDLDDYQRTAMAVQQQQPQAENTVSDRQQQKRREAALRQHTAAQRQQLASLEKRLEHLQGRLDDCDAQLAEDSLYTAQRKVQLEELLQERSKLRAEMQDLEESWYQVHEDLEQRIQKFVEQAD